jgi:hypothetical protein
LKKRYVIIGLLSAYLSAKGQSPDSHYVKKKLSSTDVQLMFSYYSQDNDHSAVTGGTGTEDLQVYASGLSFDWKKDSVRSIHLGAGADVISSASTDNIDFVVSSASKIDVRSHVNLGYTRFLKNGFTAGVSTGFSIESDYLSNSIAVQVAHVAPDQSREWSVAVQAFFDDLRWGRLENGKPQTLVYPSELRYKKWFDSYRRNSLNLEMGWYQTLNKRMAVGFYPGIVYQYGVLSTPFHRVYFNNGNKRVENLPERRWKIPVGFQLNTFPGTRWVLRAAYRFYWDDFGILAHTASVEAPVKVSAAWTVVPLLRFYTQTSADSFKPYGKHNSAQEFYTSDYDLSAFESYKAGLGVRYAPFAVRRRTTFKEIEVRYAFYKRSDGLTAHMMTMFINYGLEGKKK